MSVFESFNRGFTSALNSGNLTARTALAARQSDREDRLLPLREELMRAQAADTRTVTANRGERLDIARRQADQQDRRLDLADKSVQLEIAQHFQSLSEAEAEEARLTLENNVKMLAMTDSPERWDEMAAERAPELVGRFEDRDAIIAEHMTIREVFDRTRPAEPPAAPEISDYTDLNKAYRSDPIVSEFAKQSQAYQRIASSAEDPSAAGDLALIFNYMKLLDPGSVVRETEFATAQNAAGVPDRVRAAYNRVLSGERLAAGQRSDFVDRSKRLYDGAEAKYLDIYQQYKDTIEAFDMDPGLALRDYRFTGQIPSDPPENPGLPSQTSGTGTPQAPGDPSQTPGDGSGSPLSGIPFQSDLQRELFERFSTPE